MEELLKIIEREERPISQWNELEEVIKPHFPTNRLNKKKKK